MLDDNKRDEVGNNVVELYKLYPFKKEMAYKKIVEYQLNLLFEYFHNCNALKIEDFFKKNYID